VGFIIQIKLHCFGKADYRLTARGFRVIGSVSFDVCAEKEWYRKKKPEPVRVSHSWYNDTIKHGQSQSNVFRFFVAENQYCDTLVGLEDIQGAWRLVFF
jgi:hypothetical protein